MYSYKKHFDILQYIKVQVEENQEFYMHKCILYIPSILEITSFFWISAIRYLSKCGTSIPNGNISLEQSMQNF